jgi:hypothetical protein
MLRRPNRETPSTESTIGCITKPVAATSERSNQPDRSTETNATQTYETDSIAPNILLQEGLPNF